MTWSLNDAGERAEVTANLDEFTDALKGLAPASGGGTVNFLRADGAWEAPIGEDLTLTDVTTNDATDAKHGFLPKLSGNAAEFLNGDGAWATPAGGSDALVWTNRIWARAVFNVSTPTVSGMDTVTITGSAAAVAFSATTVYGYHPKREATAAAPATNAVAGDRINDRCCTVGGAAAGRGGFTFIVRGGPATGVATTTSRFFMGLDTDLAAPTDVQPSSVVSMVGLGYDAADTNLQIMHNDGSGTATKVDLGASFPVPTVDRTAFYELVLESPAGTTQTVDYTVTDLISGATASGTISTDMPSTTTGLAPRIWSSAGGTNSDIGIAFGGFAFDLPVLPA